MCRRESDLSGGEGLVGRGSRGLLDWRGGCLEGEEYVCWVGEGLVGRESG